jgi:hypothetical protein
VTETYSRSVSRSGGGFGGRSGISAACTGDGAEDCDLRYHGIDSSEGAVDRTRGAASTATSGVASVALSRESSGGSTSVAVGVELASRKANSASSADGLVLSTRLSALVLKAHRDSVERVVEARDTPALAFETKDIDRVADLRQALQIYDDAALVRYMLTAIWVTMSNGVVHLNFLYDIGVSLRRCSKTPASVSTTCLHHKLCEFDQQTIFINEHVSFVPIC